MIHKLFHTMFTTEYNFNYFDNSSKIIENYEMIFLLTKLSLYIVGKIRYLWENFGVQICRVFVF